ncbi:28S ribosomal protein S22, mitochondrial-like isoform X2 [Paramacrobiotus metropolitanus]|uniref:28S ribosomal protein S22, mitochondrial-like isoform X2 n=1 Tax=Paramacrobiotus metropolitanus TaxID=2943436 RepID=UPI002445ACD0|nr:28S ribosomal protein S22, mitochondrial-like isoform X2 [Paramacrobiotus metropolitanus]
MRNGFAGAPCWLAIELLYSSSPGNSIEKIFLDFRVQQTLKRLTGRDASKVFATQPVLKKKFEQSEIRLLTDQQLEQATKQKMSEIPAHTQMPPVMAPREPVDRVIVEDELLQDYDTHRNVFVDITYGIKPRDRYIVVRELNGTLRTAAWEERDRMNQIYFPVEGRELTVPAMFLEENIRDSLERGMEEYILDRACVQFEPDDPHFIRVCQTVYDYIDEMRNYSLLESTRHMGGFVFHLARERRIDNYLIYLLQNERLDMCPDVIQLCHIVHSHGTTDESISTMEPIETLKRYIKESPDNKGNLELAVQAYQEKRRQERVAQRSERRGRS